MRRSGLDKSSCLARIKQPKILQKRVALLSGCAGRHGEWMSRRLWAAPILLSACVALSACGDLGRFQTAAAPTSPGSSSAAKPAPAAGATFTASPAAEREHESVDSRAT